MKSIKTFVAVIALAASFGSFAAETVTATAATMDGAEAKIAAQARPLALHLTKLPKRLPVTACT
jgi:hypothetical protein